MSIKSHLFTLSGNVAHAPNTETGSGVQSAPIGTVAARVANLAVHALESKPLNDLLKHQIEMDDEQASGPLELMFVLEDAEENIDDWPEPDTETGNNPDKYKEPYTRKDGKPSERTRSFYEDLAESLPYCGRSIRRYQQLLEAKSKSPDLSKITLPDVAAMVAEKDMFKISAELKKEKPRATGGVKKLKNAMLLRYAVGRIVELADDANPLKVQYDLEEDQVTLKKSQYPIVITGDLAKGQYMPLTPAQVIRLGDVELIAAVKQQTSNRFVHLTSALNRGTQQNGGTKGMDIANSNQFHDVLVALNRYIDTSDKANKDRYDLLMAKMGKKDGEELVLAFGDFVKTVVADIWPKIQGRYDRLNDARVKETAGIDAGRQPQPKTVAQATA